ncbi:MAG: diguanylate cyclase [Magnetococcales bacterium]|nr:diguanylate cyclase [Magnetococcales bacterium]
MHNTLKILIVDDNPSDSRRMVRLLERLTEWTITCRECASSREAREAVNSFQPDVVFIDYLLDSDTGLDLLRSIPDADRQERAFILLTGQGDEVVAVDSLRAGVMDYLTKDGLSAKVLEHTLRFVARRISDRRALRYRDAILQAVSQVAELFLKAANWREKTTETLHALGQAVDASRAYLYENFTTPRGDLLTRKLYEWVAPGILPGMDTLDSQAFSYRDSGCQHWADIMRAGGPFQGSRSKMGAAEIAVLQPQQIQSLVLVPVFVEAEWWGVLGFDECRGERLWASTELDALSTAANTLGAAIQRERMEQLMRLQATALETAANAIFITDTAGVFIWANPAFTRITGYGHEDFHGMTPRIFKSSRHDEHFYRELWETILQGQVWRGEMVNRRKDGSLYFQETTISPVRDHSGVVTRFVSVQQDITLRKELEEKLRSQAEFDSLTGLPNRRLFDDRLAQAVSLASRNHSCMVLMFLDLDHFKEVNDTLGHDAGDELLKEAAHRISSCVRRSDTVARLGGDEFTIILPELANPDLAQLVARKILEQLNRPFYPTSREVHVSGSIGIAVFPQDGRNAEALIKSADEAMYCSKKSGRATFNFYSSPCSDGKHAIPDETAVVR